MSRSLNRQKKKSQIIFSGSVIKDGWLKATSQTRLADMEDFGAKILGWIYKDGGVISVILALGWAQEFYRHLKTMKELQSMTKIVVETLRSSTEASVKLNGTVANISNVLMIIGRGRK